ncbi:MAG: MBL fold metallo-hydrolase [Allosphingosinicella sp.]
MAPQQPSHWDHAGALADLKRRSGARLVASAADADDLARGFNVARDDTARFPAVAVDRRIGNGERLRIGTTELIAHLTPGHTPGCTSWSMRVREGNRDYDLLFGCSLTVAGQRLVGDFRYPRAAADFERSYAVLRTMRADLFLGFPTSHFDFEDKRRRLLAGDPLAFVRAGELARQVERAEAAYRAERDSQQAAAHD